MFSNIFLLYYIHTYIRVIRYNVYSKYKNLKIHILKISYKYIYIYNLARTPENGQGLGRILSCGARKQEQT